MDDMKDNGWKQGMIERRGRRVLVGRAEKGRESERKIHQRSMEGLGERKAVGGERERHRKGRGRER